MADFKKARRNLPAPPTAAEAPSNLSQPEAVPSDGRSLRATGRTMQFATRVHPSFHDRVKAYAYKHRLTMAESLERALDLLEQADR